MQKTSVKGTPERVAKSLTWLTRGYSLKESGLFSIETIAADLVAAVLGIALATFWRWAPWLIPTTVVPLFLIQRSLFVLQKRLQPAGA